MWSGVHSIRYGVAWATLLSADRETLWVGPIQMLMTGSSIEQKEWQTRAVMI